MSRMRLIGAAEGRREGLRWALNDAEIRAIMPLMTLAVIDDAPSPQLALTAAARGMDTTAGPLLVSLLAPHLRPAIAAWRRDPMWLCAAVRSDKHQRLIRCVARLCGTFRDDPAALDDAVAVLLRDAGGEIIGDGIAALGAAGWRVLDVRKQVDLFRQAFAWPPYALGAVWEALSPKQRDMTLQLIGKHATLSAYFLERLSVDVWSSLSPDWQRRLVARAASTPWTHLPASLWSDMDDDAVATWVNAILARKNEWEALTALQSLGVARTRLTADQRAAIEQIAGQKHWWRIALFRVADDGWATAATDRRRAIIETAVADEANVAALLRAIGVSGWMAMDADEHERIRTCVRRKPTSFFLCPPALWRHLQFSDPPPLAACPSEAFARWDAASDIGPLPWPYHAVVLALAPWSAADVRGETERMERLVHVWCAMTEAERDALIESQPLALPVIAAVGRRCAAHGMHRSDARSAAVTAGALAIRAMADPADLQNAFVSFLTTWFGASDLKTEATIAAMTTLGDMPQVERALRQAAQRGKVADPALCALLARRQAPTDRRTRRSAAALPALEQSRLLRQTPMARRRMR